jgi:hypothetical protein
MDEWRILSDKTTKRIRLDIALEQKFEAFERNGRSHSNTRVGRDVRMAKYTIQNITKLARNKRRG